MQFEKPDSPEDLLARITVALLITLVVSLPIVGGVMWLLFDAPTWTLASAIVIIGILMFVLAFSPMDEEETELERAEDSVRKPWLAEPTGRYGRWGQFGELLLGVWAFNLLGYLLFEVIWTAPLWVRPVFFLFSVVLGFLVEFTTFFDDADEAGQQQPLTSTSPLDSSSQRLDA